MYFQNMGLCGSCRDRQSTILSAVDCGFFLKKVTASEYRAACLMNMKTATAFIIKIFGLKRYNRLRVIFFLSTLQLIMVDRIWLAATIADPWTFNVEKLIT